MLEMVEVSSTRKRKADESMLVSEAKQSGRHTLLKLRMADPAHRIQTTKIHFGGYFLS